MSETPNLTILMPVYNEADTLERVVASFCESVVARRPCQFVVSEDGSTDGTKALLLDLAQRYPIDAHTGPQRLGYAGGVKRGFGLTQGEVIFFSDSDGQYDPKDFWKLEPAMAGSDMVIGLKVERNEALYRILLSKGFHLLLHVLFEIPLQDIDCGFRLVRRDLALPLLPEVRSLPYSFWAEFTVLFWLKGYRIRQVPVTFQDREVGGSRIYSPKALPKILWAQMRGLLRMRRRLREAGLLPRPATRA